MKNFLLFLLVINSQITYAQLSPKQVNSDTGVIGFYEFKPSGYKADSTYNYPLIIFLHGIGERGNGTTELPMSLNSSFAKILSKGATMKFLVNGKQHAFLVLIPQMSRIYTNWQNFYVDAMIKYAKANLKIDTNKIFVTGWSLGGGGAWKYATASEENARKVAGIIPVSPAPDYTNLCNLARGKVAVWAHHAKDDASVPPHYTEDAITAINQCKPDIPALLTYYPSGGHPYVADKAYDTLNDVVYPNVFQWMIGTSRSNTLGNNQPPTANAGSDTTIVLSSTNALLNGGLSRDPNDVIVSYNWSVTSGPSTPGLNIQRSAFPVTGVSGLEAGQYVFRLTVKDQFGVERFDEVNVNVVLPTDGANAIPVVNAGADISTRDNTYYIRGSARDFDGNISAFRWRQVSGPTSLTIVETGDRASLLGISEEGIYGIELAALDNHNPAGIGKDTVYITRNSNSPAYLAPFLNKKTMTKDHNMIRYGLPTGLLLFTILISLIFNSYILKKSRGNFLIMF